MIDEVRDIQSRQPTLPPSNSKFSNMGFTERPMGNDGTLTNANQEKTIVPTNTPKPLINSPSNRGDTETDTFQSTSCNTMIELSSESSDTMIINENGTETENDADSQQDTLKVRERRHERKSVRWWLMSVFKISNKQPALHLKAPFLNNSNSTPKRPVAVDRSKEDFMKSIAQEVRLFNKSGDEFQRVSEIPSRGLRSTSRPV